MSGKKLTLFQIIGYGTGHVFNDICASMWFTYLLLFFQEVLNFRSISSGQLLLVGQIADGISTLIVGVLSERLSYSLFCRKYGAKKSWHLIGTICVAVSFPFIFLPCLGCSDSVTKWQMLYYSTFIIIFQFGWACVQISHLALITALTDSPSTRTTLTSVRYGATVASNIFVYFVTWLFFGLDSSTDDISANDLDKFRNIMLTGISVGVVASLIFHITVTETNQKKKEEKTTSKERFTTYLQFFKTSKLYLVALVYISSRTFVNISQSYITLYLQNSVMLPSQFVAVIPLIMFVAGFFASFLVKTLHRYLGESLSWVAGAVAAIGTVVWLYLDASEFYLDYGIYGVAVIYGVVNSIFLITSLALTADLIGLQVESASFIYGVMSLLEKIVNGMGVLVIQSLVPCNKLGPFSNSTMPGEGLTSTTSSPAAPASSQDAWLFTDGHLNLPAPPTVFHPGSSLPIQLVGSGEGADYDYTLSNSCFMFYRSVMFSANGGTALAGAVVCLVIALLNRRYRGKEKTSDMGPVLVG